MEKIATDKFQGTREQFYLKDKTCTQVQLPLSITKEDHEKFSILELKVDNHPIGPLFQGTKETPASTAVNYQTISQLYESFQGSEIKQMRDELTSASQEIFDYAHKTYLKDN
ncbi:hypothetical protein HN903_04675 [archaeon]|jgi:hypothetical protein|nr:hypothetical protein [archaeon]MBT7129023.1 hypothetical protein [archaeon]